jgi:NAD(P)-dependent dehydrogenase (short-subunit alcohol dehydrogenase family)
VKTEKKPLLSLTGRVAIVTGAGMGIGAAIARTFARAGAKTVVADRNHESAMETAAACRREGGAAWAWKVDVTDPSAIEGLFAEVERLEGRLDILVNNAAPTGPATAKSFAAHTEEDWRSFLDTIVLGTARCCARALPLLLASKGVILNLSSAHATSPRNAAAYGAAKAAVENLTRKLANEFSSQGLRANALVPGWIETPGTAWSLADKAAVAAEIKTFLPMGRLGRPEEMANVALFMVSDLASYMTGSIVVADGGWLLR